MDGNYSILSCFVLVVVYCSGGNWYSLQVFLRSFIAVGVF